MFKPIRIRTNILFHFLFLVITLTAALIGIQYYFSEQMAKEATAKIFRQTADNITIRLRDKDMLSKEVLHQMEHHPAVNITVDQSIPMTTIRYFIHTLQRYPYMYAVYLGFKNGDFFEVVNMQINTTIRHHYKAPPHTRWSIIKIYNRSGTRIREFTFLDSRLQILGKRQESSSYLATTRPWYKEAIHTNKPVRSDPYLFSNLELEGITYSKKINMQQTVLALDFTLESLSHILSSMNFAHTGQISLFGRDKHIIASSQKRYSHITDLFPPTLIPNRVHTVKTNTTHYYTMIIPLTEEMGQKTYVGISVERDEMLAPYREKIYYALALAVMMLLLFIPLILFFTDHIIQPIKALMQENEMIKQRRFEEVKPVNTNIIEFIELSNSQIAMSQSIRDYQKQQEALLDSFIKLIADAIDAKSAYTGAHCKKVPIIAQMLADEAERSDAPPFTDFFFKSNDEKIAFRRAAWLHDCGKITTPEYVVDKATKLETIYNRIHEIRTRFEVIWRDIDIVYYKKLLQGEEKAHLEKWKIEEQQKLIEEFTFIAQCNLGSEFMDERAQKKIYQISQRTWIRHFDDRLGLSEEELQRYDHENATLPAEERLLSDKKIHLIERFGFNKDTYRKEGFKMEVPYYLYNRGELYNLTLEKGTLTPEERFKINEHIIMTIKMLESLPLPKEMKEIPKIAGEHHETMDGKGYPRQLSKEQLSIPSRIMAIADIFEALTASDRPYKKAKTLSETLLIMHGMKKEGHIDTDLFDLFIRSGVYLTYAKHYLPKSQIDDVDEKILLG